jgi:hypothetical protein
LQADGRFVFALSAVGVFAPRERWWNARLAQNIFAHANLYARNALRRNVRVHYFQRKTKPAPARSQQNINFNSVNKQQPAALAEALGYENWATRARFKAKTNTENIILFKKR